MKKLLCLLLSLAMLFGCMSAMCISTAAAGDTVLGKKVTFGDISQTGSPATYPVLRCSAGLTSLAEGTHTVSYTVYNENPFDINVRLYYQNGWSTISGASGADTLVAAGTSKRLVYTFTYANGMISSTSINPSDLTLRMDINKRATNGGNLNMPEGSTFTFAYNSTDGTDPARNLTISNGINTITTVTELPDLPTGTYAAVMNGDAENGLGNWGTFYNGTVSLSDDTKSGSGHSVKYSSPASKYGSIAYVLGGKVINDRANGYNGGGAGTYIVTFDAKANKPAKFSAILNSGQHLNPSQIATAIGGNASDYVNTWTGGAQIALTEAWNSYTVRVTIPQIYLDTLKALFDAGKEDAYKLFLRFDGSTAGNAYNLDDLSTDYYVDNVAIEKEVVTPTPTPTATPTSSPDVPVTTSPTGISYTFGSNAEGLWMITGTGLFSEEDIVAGNLVVKYLIFNESDEDIQFTMRVQTNTGSAWEGPSTSTSTFVLSEMYQWVTLTIPLNADNTITVSGKNYTLSKFFLRLDFSGTTPAGTNFVIACDPNEVNALKSISAKSSLSKVETYDAKYNHTVYPMEDEEPEITTDLRINRVFNNDMVLQRDQQIRIWGTSSKVGATVTVNFKNKNTSTTVKSDGTWEMLLPAESADKNENTLTASCDGEEYVLTGILIGDVYLLGGQSNAEKQLSACGSQYSTAYKKSIIASGDGMIRYFQQSRGDTTNDFNKARMDSPQTDPISLKKWKKENLASASEFSAMGFFFAHKMYDETDVPMGIIMVASSGSPLSQLMSKEASDATGYKKFENNIPVSGMYNSLMHPFIRMSIKGMIFYQGESEMGLAVSDYGKYNVYLKAYVDDLRAKNGTNFPFYYVQMSSHAGEGMTSWPNQAPQRAVQFDGVKMIDNCGMVVSMDMGYLVGQTDWAHPDRKQPVGERLAALALCRDYGIGNEEYVTSPFPILAYRSENGIVIRFEHVAGGLCKAGTYSTLTGFKAITSSGYVNVEAEIVGKNEVLLKTNSVAGVTGVGYGLENIAFTEYDDPKYIANLGNEAGLPAPTFKLTTILNEKPADPEPTVNEKAGDIDGDGSITQLDRMILARCIAGWDGYETLDIEAADINGDGKITAKDRMILSRFLDGWESYDVYFPSTTPQQPEEPNDPQQQDPDSPIILPIIHL